MTRLLFLQKASTSVRVAVRLACIASVLAAMPARAQNCTPTWVAGWASSQFRPTGDAALPLGTLANQTLRQIVRPSVSGDRVRIRLSNLAGTKPLPILGASIARAPRSAAPTIDPASRIALRFDGKPDVIIPPGADYLSDPVTLSAKALDTLAISIRYAAADPEQTAHPGSRATS